jgi:hypothetical protein
LIAKKLEISLQLDYKIKRQTDFKELIRTSHQCALIGGKKDDSHLVIVKTLK